MGFFDVKNQVIVCVRIREVMICELNQGLVENCW